LIVVLSDSDAAWIASPSARTTEPLSIRNRMRATISPEEIQRVGEPALADVCVGTPAEH
jgi:hypothetical protein